MLTGRIVRLSGFFRLGHDKEAWRIMVRARGFSPLGTPTFLVDTDTGEPITYGRIALAPGFEYMDALLSPEAESFVCYP